MHQFSRLFLRSCVGIFLVSFLILPNFTYAQPIPRPNEGSGYPTINGGKGFVTCNPGTTGTDPNKPCTFENLYDLINWVWKFLLEFVLAPVAIIALVFAGFKYVTAQGNPGEIKKAHDIFYYTVVGMLVAFAAWLIVNTILTGLVAKINFLKQS